MTNALGWAPILRDGRSAPIDPATTTSRSGRRDALTESIALMRADTVGIRTDTVERLLGRAPRTFADRCTRHADAFLSLDTTSRSASPA
ncbi:hypothetical protein [Streptomyces aquilus]|uniref:hypothetical protein n=1 Tax=Streptomyces aquilus TaxID=2548456 RepID=UPI003693C415